MSTTDAQFKRFKGLDEEWRNDAMARKDPEELNKLIRESAVNIVELRLAREMDEDLARIKEELATAQKVYKDGEKENALRIEFLVECLKTMGVKVSSFSKKTVLAEAAKAKAEDEPADDSALFETPEAKKAVKKFKNGIPKNTTVTITGLGGRQIVLSGPTDPVPEPELRDDGGQDPF